MNTPTAARKFKETPEPEPPVGAVRHLTEADLSEDDRTRLFSCLNRGKRWFDRPTKPLSFRSQERSPRARVQQDKVEPQELT